MGWLSFYAILLTPVNLKKSILANYLESLGLVYWYDGDMNSLRQTTEALLNIPREHLQPGTVS